MRLEDMKKDIPETPEFIHTMIQSEVKKQLQDTKVVNIQTRRVKKWTGARVAAAIAVCVLATSTIVYAGTKSSSSKSTDAKLNPPVRSCSGYSR